MQLSRTQRHVLCEWTKWHVAHGCWKLRLPCAYIRVELGIFLSSDLIRWICFLLPMKFFMCDLIIFVGRLSFNSSYMFIDYAQYVIICDRDWTRISFQNRWSRKGFMRTRWKLNQVEFDFINIHLFHDSSNLVSAENVRFLVWLQIVRMKSGIN